MTTTQQLKLIIAGLLIALAGTLAYYNLKETSGKKENAKNTETPIKGTVGEPKSGNICSDFSNEAPPTLETGVISDLVEQYRSRQLAAIDATMADPDAHSVWFDLDTIKKFIYHIEKNVGKNAPANQNKLGLRLYYAAYPDKALFASKTDLSQVDARYEYKHTVVMIPTINNPIVGDVDFNPLDKNTYDGFISEKKSIRVRNSPVLLAEYQVAGYNPMALTNATRTAGRNHGSLIPPGVRTVEGF